MKKLKLVNTIFMVFFLAACSAPDKNMYYWGNYDRVIYTHYNEEGNFAKQKEALNEIITSSQKTAKSIPPGVYGHLGLILLKQGKSEEANLAFQEEMKLFPESSQFMQYLQRKNKDNS